ncbi:MAG: crossover junction endodeoxyribonuclease RuvC [Peptococcaceae bacterium]|nr:crossover junction endodeoxyribonuclease RuvC [Peptococcaceae bacterium]
MIILGIDPGTATTGFGIIRVAGNSIKPVDYGVISTPAGVPMEQRLVMIYEQMNQIIDRWKPEQVAIEELFFNKNITTGITVGQARGVLLLSCAQKGLQVHEYTPLQVKQALVGNGRAEKQQVQFMVKTFLGLREVPKPDDAADALAIAICHTHHHQTRTRSTQR